MKSNAVHTITHVVYIPKRPGVCRCHRHKIASKKDENEVEPIYLREGSSGIQFSIKIPRE